MKNIINFLFLFSLTFIYANNMPDEGNLLNRENLSGRDYFNGIFFAKGNIAQAIPFIKNSKRFYKIQNLNEKDNAKYEEDVRKLGNIINKNEPSYFAELKASIDNSNHLLVKEYILKGANILFKATVDLYVSELTLEEKDEFIKKGIKENYINEDKSINYKELLKNSVKFSIKGGECEVLAVAVAIVSYLAITYAVVIAWVAEVVSAIDVTEDPSLDLAESFADAYDNGGGEFGEICEAAPEQLLRRKNLNLEILINEIITYNS